MQEAKTTRLNLNGDKEVNNLELQCQLQEVVMQEALNKLIYMMIEKNVQIVKESLMKWQLTSTFRNVTKSIELRVLGYDYQSIGFNLFKLF